MTQFHSFEEDYPEDNIPEEWTEPVDAIPSRDHSPVKAPSAAAASSSPVKFCTPVQDSDDGYDDEPSDEDDDDVPVKYCTPVSVSAHGLKDPTEVERPAQATTRGVTSLLDEVIVEEDEEEDEDHPQHKSPPTSPPIIITPPQQTPPQSSALSPEKPRPKSPVIEELYERVQSLTKKSSSDQSPPGGEQVSPINSPHRRTSVETPSPVASAPASRKSSVTSSKGSNNNCSSKLQVPRNDCTLLTLTDCAQKPFLLYSQVPLQDHEKAL